ncbi:hypothetical protein FM142_00180 [Proteus mirabilis]|nr:hypothetical protein FM142_00180 [Proteus mirabilis]
MKTHLIENKQIKQNKPYYKKKQKNILFKKEKFYFYFCFYFCFKLLKIRFIKSKKFCLTYTVFY